MKTDSCHAVDIVLPFMLVLGEVFCAVCFVQTPVSQVADTVRAPAMAFRQCKYKTDVVLCNRNVDVV